MFTEIKGQYAEKPKHRKMLVGFSGKYMVLSGRERILEESARSQPVCLYIVYFQQLGTLGIGRPYDSNAELILFAK